MSKSWGWRIIPFTEKDTAYYLRTAESTRPEWRYYYLCRRKGCGATPEVFVAYNYVTGRAGRLSYQQRPFCRAHGEEAVAAHQPEAA
jgi:hypothetical protein